MYKKIKISYEEEQQELKDALPKIQSYLETDGRSIQKNTLQNAKKNGIAKSYTV